MATCLAATRGDDRPTWSESTFGDLVREEILTCKGTYRWRSSRVRAATARLGGPGVLKQGRRPENALALTLGAEVRLFESEGSICHLKRCGRGRGRARVLQQSGLKGWTWFKYYVVPTVVFDDLDVSS